MTDKSFFDHVSDWFRILLRSGIPALLVGLGWVAVIIGSVLYGSAWNVNAGFWALTIVGAGMIIAGTWIYLKELRSIPHETDS